MVNGIYRSIKSALAAAGNENSAFEARCICCRAFSVSEPTLLSGCFEETDEGVRLAEEMLSRRLDGEPLQYIIGKWEFYGLEFITESGVLIPRADTECVVDAALECIGKKKALVADLCAGSGCIGIAIEKHSGSRVFSVENSKAAIEILKRNIALNASSAVPVEGDILSEETAAGFRGLDLIVCNPPYLDKDDMSELQREVGFEPFEALFGGDDGLDFYRIVPLLWKNSLCKDGAIIFEIGASQQKAVEALLESAGFAVFDNKCDGGGIVRAICAKKR